MVGKCLTLSTIFCRCVLDKQPVPSTPSFALVSAGIFCSPPQPQTRSFRRRMSLRQRFYGFDPFCVTILGLTSLFISYIIEALQSIIETIMKNTFPSFYQPSKENFQELWNTGLFIFDASVLLNLYRYPSQARQDLLSVLKSVQHRLWIPYQAALEYQENRLNVIAEQMKRFEDVRTILDKTEQALNHGLDQLQLAKRHSAIRVDDFVRGIHSRIRNFKNRLDELQEAQPDVSAHDVLREEISYLFADKIGQPPSQKALDELYEEGELRYQNKQPPGYLDAHKEDECYPFGELCFKRKFGDLILWYQVIEHVKTSDTKAVILLTDDKKEDWWWIVHSRGEKIIGPRPELVQEIKSKTNVSIFYMYNSERFIEYAGQYLGITIQKKSIEQVRDFTTFDQVLLSTEREEPLKNLPLYSFLTLHVHLLATKTSRFRTIADLPLKAKIAVPNMSEGVKEWLISALSAYGIELIPVVIPNSEIPLAIERNIIDAALVLTHPSAVLAYPIRMGRIRLLPWSEEAIIHVLADYPSVLIRSLLPDNIYTNQTEPVLGYAPKNT